MSRTRTATLALGAVALLAAAWWARTQQPAPSDGPVGPVQRVVAEDATDDTKMPELPPSLLAGRVALTATYRFTLSGGEALGSVEAELHGELQVGDKRQFEGARWLPARVTKGRFSTSEAGKRVFSSEAASQLERPFWIRLDAQGRVADLHFAPSVAVPVRSVLSDLVYTTQWERRAGAEAGPWTATERDLNGRHQANYTRPAADRVEKRWRTPAEHVGLSGRTETVFDLDGQGIAAISRRSEGSARISLRDSDARAPLSLTIALRRAGQPDLAWATGLSPAGFVPSSVEPRQPHKQAVNPPHRSAQVVLAEVTQRAHKTDSAGRANLRNELTYALRDSDQAVSRVARALRDGSLSQQAEMVAIAALAGGGTEKAQEAMAELAEDRGLSTRTSVAVLQAATFMPHPNAAFLRRLAALSTDASRPAHAGRAATALGAALGHHKQDDPKAATPKIHAYVRQASRVVTGLERPPGGATGVPDKPGQPDAPELPPAGVRIAWLAGLGNLTDSAALPTLFAGLEDGNELVRGSAALALRFQDPAACMPWMTKLMAVDHSIHVRENLVDAARFMGPKAARPLVEKALFYDESHHVRLAAAYTLSFWSNDVPKLRKVLVQALKREKNPRVAEALQNYIQEGRVPGKPSIKPVKAK